MERPKKYVQVLALAEVIQKQNKCYIDPQFLAETFGVRSPLDKCLEEASTQKARWKVLDKSPSGSKMEQKVCRAIFINATTQRERSDMFRATSDQELKKEILEVIETQARIDLARAKTVQALWEVFHDVPDISPLREEVLQRLFHYAINQEEWIGLYTTTNNPDLKGDILREIVDHLE